jgi:hypothetical protein
VAPSTAPARATPGEHHRRSATTPGTIGAKVGYAVTVVVNAVLWWVVNHLTDWHITRFVTDEFGDVRPWVLASLAVAMAANAVYLFRDIKPVRAVGELASHVASLASVVVTLWVFPFDFADYSVDWGPLCRFALVITLIGTMVAAVAEVVRLVRAATPVT